MAVRERPPMKVSDEAKQDQLQLARQQGDAYVKALNEMAHREADAGGEQQAGDYIVAYAVETAEGLYRLEDGELQWEAPTDENAHVEVSVRDAADNRFIPGLDVRVRLLDENGDEVGFHKQEFLWHPWIYHYGRNWHVPGDGTYRMEVHIAAPNFPRHDKKNGKRYAEDVQVEFDSVKIKTGQKKSKG